MITDSGKEIISKYLLGQIPSYASHISIGCGAKPLDANDVAPLPAELAAKTKMDFEMIRVPISSKGFVDDNGTTKVSFTADLPKENKYDITEIGLWSSGSNSLAASFNSRTIFNFSEDWQAHSTSISSITTPTPLGITGDITTALKQFRASSSDSVFSTSERRSRKEGPRFLDSKILLRGDSSVIQGATGSWSGENPSFNVNNKEKAGTTAILTTVTHLLNVGDSITVNISDLEFDGTHEITARTNTEITYEHDLSSTVASIAAAGTVVFSGSTHIHLNAINFDISKNSPSDTISLAFSLIDKDSVGGGDPDYVKILVEFYRNETSITTGFAKAEVYIAGGEFANDRYKVVEIPISSLITSPDFSSEQIRVARVFASVIYTASGEQMSSPLHYVELEGLRIENETTINPVYGMVGYSIVRTPDGQPIHKYKNTNNYVEFRFNLDVG